MSILENDEKYRIAHEERHEKARIAFKEQIEHINATWMAKVAMLLMVEASDRKQTNAGKWNLNRSKSR